MDSVKQLQKKLDAVFTNGAIFTYDMKPARATLIASKGWALREHEDTVLVGIVFATIQRRWVHRVSEVKKEGDGLALILANGKSVSLRPLNTQFVHPDILAAIQNDNRIKEELDEEVDGYLEANPHKSLANF